MRNKNRIWIGIVFVILIIILFSYNSYSIKKQKAKWEEETKINSIRIIDVEPTNTAEQEAKACSLCNLALGVENNGGVYIGSDGTKTCSLEIGFEDIEGDCDKIMSSSSQSECKGGSLKLTFQIDSKTTNSLDCKVYNNNQVYPGEGNSYVFDQGLNVMQYAPRDYSQNPQEYKICCETPIYNGSSVCSEEYSYHNPC